MCIKNIFLAINIIPYFMGFFFNLRPWFLFLFFLFLNIQVLVCFVELLTDVGTIVG